MGDFSVKAVLSAVDKNFSSTMNSALGSLKGVPSAATSATNSIMKIATGIGVFKALSAGANLLKSSVSSAFSRQDTMEQFNRTISQITGSTDAAAGALDNLKGITKGTAYGLDVAAKATQDFVTRGMGIESATKSVGAWADAVAFYGRGTNAELQSVTDAIAKMRTKGKVEMDQLNRLFDVGIDAVGMYAKAVGRDSSSVQADLSSGKISAEDFLNTVESAMEEGTNGVQKIAGAAKQAGASWTGTFDNMRAAVTRGTLGIINSIDGMLANNGLPTMREYIKMFGDTAESVLNKVSGMIGKIDLRSVIDKAIPYWEAFKSSAIEVKDAFGKAIDAIMSSLGKLGGAFGSVDSVNSFSDYLGIATSALTNFAGFCEKHSDTIAKLISILPKLFIAYQGFKILRSVAPLAAVFTGAIGGLAKLGLSKLAPNLFGVAKGQDAVGKSSGGSTKKMVASAKAFAMLGAGVLMISAGFYLLARSAVEVANAGPMAVGVLAGLVVVVTALSVGMIKMLSSMSGGTKKLAAMSTAMLALGASVLLISVGFYLLAQAAISLASAGPLAIGVMAGMVVAVALLAAGAAALGPALTAGAVGFIAFGGAIVLVGVGALLAATALMLVSSVLPTVVQYGASGAVAIAQLALGMTAFSVGTALAGAGCIVLGAGLVVVATGLALVGAAVLVTAVGVLALAAGVVVLGAGVTLTAAALTMTGAALPSVASGALITTTAFAALLAMSLALTVSLTLLSVPLLLLGTSFVVATVGVAAFGVAMAAGSAGTLVMAAALKAVNSSMKSIASNAKTASSSITSMVSSVNVVNSGLDALGNKAKSAVNKLTSAFSGGAGKAQSAGRALANGAKNGVQAGLQQLPTVASSAMLSFNMSLRAGGNTATATARSMSNNIVSAMRSASSGSYSSGYNIGIGLANGMRACLGTVRSVAAQLASAAEAAIRAKAKIHSPSKVSTQLGGFWGEGYVVGLKDKVKDAAKAAREFVSIPHFQNERLAYSGAGNIQLSEDYDYSSKSYVYIEVPVNLDGREVARVSAPYTQEELNKREARNNRNHGRR